MLNVVTKFYKIERKQHEMMHNSLSLSLIIIWEPAIETWAQEMNGGPGNELRAQRAEQFPHFGNYTLTPVGDVVVAVAACKSVLTITTL